ncbi:MAG: hypothetical protein U5L45_12895 [Saprospiraceae bacterium]|nr:hypothetical protein [Saprospiraceae bacterium]
MPMDSLRQRWDVVKNDKNASWTVGLSKLKSMSVHKQFDGMIVPKKESVGGFTGTSYLMGRNALDKIFLVPETLPNEDSWMMYAISMLPQIQIKQSGIISNYWRVHEGNSINMMSDFDTYNRKITPRLKAPELFLEKFKYELPNDVVLKLEREIKCEEKRQKKDIIGILLSDLPLVGRLRTLSMTNSSFYFFRKHFYKFFSGW